MTPSGGSLLHGCQATFGAGPSRCWQQQPLCLCLKAIALCCTLSAIGAISGGALPDMSASPSTKCPLDWTLLSGALLLHSCQAIVAAS